MRGERALTGTRGRWRRPQQEEKRASMAWRANGDGPKRTAGHVVRHGGCAGADRGGCAIEGAK